MRVEPAMVIVQPANLHEKSPQRSTVSFGDLNSRPAGPRHQWRLVGLKLLGRAFLDEFRQS